MTTYATPDDVDQMIATLPRQEQVVVKRLRSLVLECIPQATEQSYYDIRIPFYRRNKLICFIWPPSLSWETSAKIEKRKSNGVTLGFSQGYLMSNEDGVLQAEGRKQVYVMYFKTLKEIDEHQVRALLYEAAMIDEEFGNKRKRRK